MKEEMITLINNINTAINTAKEQEGVTYDYIVQDQEIKSIPENWGEYFYTGLLNDGATKEIGSLSAYIKKVPAFPTSRYPFPASTGTYALFRYCKRLKIIDLAGLDCGYPASNAFEMFKGCTSLKEVKNFTDPGLVTFTSAFEDCTSLVNLSLPNVTLSTSSAQFQKMFKNCSNLVSINLPGFACDGCKDVTDIFYGCSSLTTITGTNIFKNLGKNYSQKTANYSKYKLNLSPATNLTHDSIMLIINNLYDLNTTYGETLYTQTLQLGTTNLNKLTTEEKAIATTKGWTLS